MTTALLIPTQAIPHAIPILGDSSTTRVLANNGLLAGGVAVTLQYARPASDTAAGGWIPISGSDLYAMLDEEVASDVDYIYCVAETVATVALSPVNDPFSSLAHTVRYRAKGDGSTDLKVYLMQGAVEVASWTETAVDTDWQDFAHTLSSGEADAITDYTVLALKFESIVP